VPSDAEVLNVDVLMCLSHCCGEYLFYKMPSTESLTL